MAKREILIYDDIGPSWAGMVGAEWFAEQLQTLGSGDVHVRVNSYGGSVDEALAMVELAFGHDGNVTVSVDSIAASAATFFPASFPSTIAKHGRVMIHNPWGIVAGNADDLRRTADVLDTYRDSIVAIYENGFNGDADEIRAAMDAETWYSADAAVDAGLVDAVTDGGKAKANGCAPGRFKNTPRDLLDVSKPRYDAQPQPNLVAAKLRAMRVANQNRKRRILR